MLINDTYYYLFECSSKTEIGTFAPLFPQSPISQNSVRDILTNKIIAAEQYFDETMRAKYSANIDRRLLELIEKPKGKK